MYTHILAMYITGEFMGWSGWVGDVGCSRKGGSAPPPPLLTLSEAVRGLELFIIRIGQLEV